MTKVHEIYLIDELQHSGTYLDARLFRNPYIYLQEFDNLNYIWAP